jgi:hypothetical protein
VLASASGAAAIISALGTFIWPLAVLFAIVVFRKPLTSALGRVSEVDVAGAKIVLQGQADRAANAAKKVASSAQNLPPPSDAMKSAAAAAVKDPAGSVLTAWKDVEDTIRPAGAAMGGAQSPSVPDMVKSMVNDHKLDPSLETVADSLESVRKVAAMGGSAVSPAAAVSFVSAAEDLTRLVKSAM